MDNKLILISLIVLIVLYFFITSLTIHYNDYGYKGCSLFSKKNNYCLGKKLERLVSEEEKKSILSQYRSDENDSGIHMGNKITNFKLQKICKTNKQNGRKFCYKAFSNESDMIFQELFDFYNNLISILPKNDPRIQRLLKKFNIYNSALFEVNPNNGEDLTSYTINKGIEMGLCLRDKNISIPLNKRLNTIKFVFAHELSHVMTISSHHTPEFWENFKWLLGHIYNNKLIPIIDYKSTPEIYCGLNIRHNPYLDK